MDFTTIYDTDNQPVAIHWYHEDIQQIDILPNTTRTQSWFDTINWLLAHYVPDVKLFKHSTHQYGMNYEGAGYVFYNLPMNQRHEVCY